MKTRKPNRLVLARDFKNWLAREIAAEMVEETEADIAKAYGSEDARHAELGAKVSVGVSMVSKGYPCSPCTSDAHGVPPDEEDEELGDTPQERIHDAAKLVVADYCVAAVEAESWVDNHLDSFDSRVALAGALGVFFSIDGGEHPGKLHYLFVSGHMDDYLDDAEIAAAVLLERRDELLEYIWAVCKLTGEIERQARSEFESHIAPAVWRT